MAVVVLRMLPLLLELGLLIYCLIDCIQSGEEEIRNLPKWAWIILILLFPLVGGIAWLVAGRPLRARHGHGAGPPAGGAGYPGYGQKPYPIGPDDDPEYLDQIERRRREHPDEDPPAHPA